MRYMIEGDTLPVVICEVEPGETMITEGGAMSWMTPNMNMETTSNGGIGKIFSRAFSGESLFLNKYTATGGVGQIAFASSFPGSIKKFDIAPGEEIIAQKSAFLAATSGVNLSIHFQKRLGAGFFGGEGFIMQKISGNGLAFLEIDGNCSEYMLGPGESILIDTGHLAAMSETCTMDVQTVKGIKNALFGGEGIFLTRVTGPGKVYLQSMPISNVANLIGAKINVGNKSGGFNISLGD